MDRYERPGPPDEAARHGYHDPLEYWDRLPDQMEQMRWSLLLGAGGSRNLEGGRRPDLGQLVEDVVLLLGASIRGVLLLVTWPVRWARRRR
ncbi:MAG TPA: hypothetical protein VJQ83_03130 [Tepidiformaceae bacterium]|nr:hypothetical protein [Tepidiformaceae bacterium]